jgi:hypothetical protein
MPCIPFQHQGMHGFVCHRGPAPKPKPCRYCGQPATCLCDHPQGKRTCDTPMCAACATEVDADLHQCREHGEPGLY